MHAFMRACVRVECSGRLNAFEMVWANTMHLATTRPRSLQRNRRDSGFSRGLYDSSTTIETRSLLLAIILLQQRCYPYADER